MAVDYEVIYDDVDDSYFLIRNDYPIGRNYDTEADARHAALVRSIYTRDWEA